MHRKLYAHNQRQKHVSIYLQAILLFPPDHKSSESWVNPQSLCRLQDFSEIMKVIRTVKSLNSKGVCITNKSPSNLKMQDKIKLTCK